MSELPLGVVRVGPGHFVRAGYEPLTAAEWAIVNGWLETEATALALGFTDRAPSSSQMPSPRLTAAAPPPEEPSDPDADLDAVLAAVGWERAR